MSSYVVNSSTHFIHPSHSQASTPTLHHQNLATVYFKSPPSSVVNVHTSKYVMFYVFMRYYVFLLIKPGQCLACPQQMQPLCIVTVKQGISVYLPTIQKHVILGVHGPSNLCSTTLHTYIAQLIISTFPFPLFDSSLLDQAKHTVDAVDGLATFTYICYI